MDPFTFSNDSKSLSVFFGAKNNQFYLHIIMHTFSQNMIKSGNQNYKNSSYSMH